MTKGSVSILSEGFVKFSMLITTDSGASVRRTNAFKRVTVCPEREQVRVDSTPSIPVHEDSETGVTYEGNVTVMYMPWTKLEGVRVSW